MTRTIDIRHLGLDRVIAAHQVGEVIIDPGPASGLDNLLDGLEGEPRAILLTHIHLDHAGATGHLAERFPDARVYVHRVGAPHVIDPEKLWQSAGRIYDDMDGTWGRPLPVPEDRITILDGGERAEGMRVLHTPGHAGHHVTYFDESTGDAFTGDVAGVRIPPGAYVLAPTPPPEIDLEAWERSLSLLSSLDARRLRLTHFGEVDDPAAQIDLARSALRRQSERARSLGREDFLAQLADEVRDSTSGSVRDRLEQAVPPEHVWLGLERYWRKRAEREAAGEA